MVSLTLLSTALMGLLVVATFVAVAQIGAKRTAPGAGSASRVRRDNRDS